MESELRDEDIGRCSDCGSTEGFTAHRFIGRDATGEPVDDCWVQCVSCGARSKG